MKEFSKKSLLLLLAFSLIIPHFAGATGIYSQANAATNPYASNHQATDHIIYVKEAATGNNDGSSWTHAFNDFQDALDAAEPADGEHIEIWIAAGTYIPTKIAEDFDYLVRSDQFPSFRMKNNVTIYGGFPADATDGVGMSSRDWTVHETIFSGHTDGIHVPITDKDTRQGLLEGRSDNTRSVFLHPASLQLDETAVLDGVTITGGTTSANVNPGAGMLNDGLIEEDGTVMGNDPVLRNVTITDNISLVGAGIYNGPGSHMTLENVTITHNIAHSEFGPGGYRKAGVGIHNEGSMTIRNSEISHNDYSTLRGNYVSVAVGGIYNAGTMTIEHSDLHDNIGYRDGGAIANSGELTVRGGTLSANSIGSYNGGGAGVYHQSGYTHLIDVEMIGNELPRTDSRGAGILVDGIEDSEVVLTGVTIADNRTEGRGAGIASSTSNEAKLTIQNSIIRDNEVTRNNDGGGVFWQRGELILDDVLIAGNIASNGGGIYNQSPNLMKLNNVRLWDNTASNVLGGGIYFSGEHLVMTNSYVQDNSGPTGGGLALTGYSSAPESEIEITNTLITGNKANFNGGGINSTISNSQIVLTNVTIADNSSKDPGAGINRAGSSSELYLRNSIVANNMRVADGQLPEASNLRVTNAHSSTFVQSSLVEGAFDDEGKWNSSIGSDEGGNIDGDPLFVEPYFSESRNGNYRLLEDSPAIDQGDNELVPPGIVTDLQGLERILDDIVDMGAYEFGEDTLAPEWPARAELQLRSTVDPTDASLQVDLTWPAAEDNIAVVTYAVYHEDLLVTDQLMAHERTYSIRNLDANVPQTFSVLAADEAGNWSEPLSETYEPDFYGTPPTWPGDASLQTIRQVGQTFVTLSWPAADGQVETYTLTQSPGDVTYPIDPGFTTFTVERLQPETEYTFELTASGQGETTKPLTLQVTTASSDADIVALSVESRAGGQADLLWDAAGVALEISGYRIERRVSGSSEWQSRGEVDRETTTFRDTNLRAGTTYEYRIMLLFADLETTQVHTDIAELTTAELDVRNLFWNLSERRGADTAAIGDTMSFTLTGEQGREGFIELHYTSWYDDAGIPLDEPQAKRTTVMLHEQAGSVGIYEGQFTIPEGIAQFTAIAGVLTDGEQEQRISESVSLRVLGQLEIEVKNNSADSFVEKLWLHAWSDERQDGDKMAITESGTYSLVLPAAEDYELRLQTARRADVATAKTDVRTRAGMTDSATLDYEGTARISIRTTIPGGVYGDEEQEAPAPLQLIIKDAKTGLTLQSKRSELGSEAFIFSQDEFLNRLDIDKLQVTVNAPWPGQPSHVETIDVSPGTYTVDVELPPSAVFVPITGVVTNSEGNVVAGANVSVVQSEQEMTGWTKGYTQHTKTDTEGRYKLEGLTGKANVSAIGQVNTNLRGGKADHITLTDEPVELDLQLADIHRYSLHVGSLTYVVGDTEHRLTSMGGSEAESYRFRASALDIDHPTRQKQVRASRVTGGYPMELWLPEGAEVTFCLTPVLQGLPEQCVVMTAGSERELKPDFYYDESYLAGTVEGQLLLPNGTPWNSDHASTRAASMTLTDEAGRSVWGSTGKSVEAFEFHIAEPGEYTLHFSGVHDGVTHVAKEVINLLAEGSVHVGDVTMQPSGRFGLSRGNMIDAEPIEAMPGSYVTVRGTYENTERDTVTDAQFNFTLPDGMTYQDGSLLLNGTPHDPVKKTEQTFSFELGTLNGRSHGDFQFRLNVLEDQQSSSNDLQTTIRYTGKDGIEQEEWFGEVAFIVGGLSISAAEQIHDFKQRVHGRAERGSTVKVYVDQLLLGETVAAPNGYWQLDVELPEQTSPHWYTLHATAELDGEDTYAQTNVTMLYDTSQPRLESVKMRQGSKEEHIANLAPRALGNIPRFIGATSEWVGFSTTGGIARFPRTMLAGLPFEFELFFNEPEQVSNVYVYVDGPAGGSAPAELGDDGVWRAFIETDRAATWRLGDISVSFDTDHPEGAPETPEVLAEKMRQTPAAQSMTIGEEALDLVDEFPPFDDPDWTLDEADEDVNSGIVRSRHVQRDPVHFANGDIIGWRQLSIEPLSDVGGADNFSLEPDVQVRGIGVSRTNSRDIISATGIELIVRQDLTISQIIAQDPNPSAPEWPSAAELIVKDMSGDGREVTAAWHIPEDSLWIDQYEIYELNTNGQRGRKLAEVFGDTTEVTIAGLTPGQSYAFQVVASNPHELSSAGPIVRFEAGNMSSVAHAQALQTFMATSEILVETKFQQEVRVAAAQNLGPVRVASNTVLKGIGGLDIISTIKNTAGIHREMKQLEQLLKDYENCFGNIPPYLQEAVDKMTLAIIADAAAGVMWLTAGALVPTAPTGAGFVGAVGMAIGGGVTTVGSIFYKRKVTRELKRAEERAEAESGKTCRPKKKIANPQWKIDPSGIVYEVTEDQVIPGVTATVLFSESEEGPYEVWDGDWWGEENPQQTDASGWYGWDVPEGWWRVIYEKEGYETTYSQDSYGPIEVPPPHFDVNVPMRSLAAPVVEEVNAALGGEAIEITFSRYMKQSKLNENTVWLQTGDEDRSFITGHLEFIDPVVDPHSDTEEKTLVRTVRIIFDNPVSIGEEVDLMVRDLVESYAGVFMEEEYTEKLTIKEKVVLESLQVTPVDLSIEAGDVQFFHVTASYSDGSTTDVTDTVTWISSNEDVAYVAGLNRIDSVGTGTVTITATLDGVSASTELEVVATGDPIDPKDPTDPGDPEEPGDGDPGDPEDPTDPGDPEEPGDGDPGDPEDPTDPGDPEEPGDGDPGDPEESDMYEPVPGRTPTPSPQPDMEQGEEDEQGEQDDPDESSDREDLDSPEERACANIFVPLFSADESVTLQIHAFDADCTEASVKMLLSAGWANTDETLHVSPVSTNNLPEAASSHETHNIAYRINLADTGASQLPAPLLMEVDLSDIAYNEQQRERLGLYQYDTEALAWMYLPGRVDPEANTLTAVVKQTGTVVVMSSDVTFTDIDEHWAQQTIEVLAGQGIISGRTDGTFDPSAAISRAEFTALLVRLVGLDRSEATHTQSESFTDVAVTDWFYEDVTAAAEAKLVSGTSATTFSPHEPISRQEIAVLLTRTLSALGMDTNSGAKQIRETLTPFTDADQTSSWARNAITFMVDQGIVRGRSAQTLAPTGDTTRAEAAILLQGFFEVWWQHDPTAQVN